VKFNNQQEYFFISNDLLIGPENIGQFFWDLTLTHLKLDETLNDIANEAEISLFLNVKLIIIAI